MDTALNWTDILIIIAYIIFVLIIGLWSSIKARGGGVDGYFLAGRKMNWFLVGSSLFGSCIGSEHFIGLAGSGAASGIGIAGFEINAMFVLMLLGWVFLPVYIASGVYTMPEYIKKRYGGRRIRIYLTCIALILTIFTKIAADLFAGAIFIKIAMGWNLYWAILLQLGVACISTVSGGLRAVMWTDTAQVIIMVLGALYLMAISFNEVGGYLALTQKYHLAVPNNASVIYAGSEKKCSGVPPLDSMVMLRSIDNPDLPWLGATLGLTVSAVWYWCNDQVIVQKALSSKNYSHAKGGCILAALYKFLPMWCIVFPGMIARVLYPNEIGCTDPKVCEQICYSPNGCTNVAYPLLVTRLLPTGLKGIMVAVMMSAIMSSLSSIFNSSSTIFTIDIWEPIRKKSTALELLIVGRLFVIFMVLIAICWIPIIAAFPNGQLFVYVQSVTSYLAPPVCATFVMGILVPRSNESGAFWSLMVGLVIGVARFILEVSYVAPACFEEDTRPLLLAKVHYLHFGLLLFVIVCLVNFVVSLWTMKINEIHLTRLTFWSRNSTADRISLSGDFKEISASGSKLVNNGLSKPSKLRKFAYILCGLKEHSVDESLGVKSEDKISLNETTFWRVSTNIGAIMIVTIALFVYCFWS